VHRLVDVAQIGEDLVGLLQRGRDLVLDIAAEPANRLGICFRHDDLTVAAVDGWFHRVADAGTPLDRASSGRKPSSPPAGRRLGPWTAAAPKRRSARADAP